MTAWLFTAPRWLVCGLAGVLSAVLFAAFGRLNGYGWVETVATGAIGGALLGLAMGFLTGASRRRLLESAGSLSAERRLSAVRLALSRRAPEAGADPRVVRGARDVAAYRREENRRQQSATVLVLAVLLVLGTAMTLINSPWWLISVAVFAVAIVVSLDRPRRLRIRAERLDAAVAELRRVRKPGRTPDHPTGSTRSHRPR